MSPGSSPGSDGTRSGWRAGLWGELGAELLGTLVLIAFGCGVVAMAVAALNQSGRGEAVFDASGDWLLITWGWGLAVAMAIYVAGGVTGAHLNPAVTLALAVRRGFPWRKVPAYVAAQTAGAFLGAALVYLNYHDAIAAFESSQNIVRGDLGGAGDSTATFSIFATFPAVYYGADLLGPFIDQVIGTALLVLLVLAITDDRNLPVKSNLAPFMVGLVVAAIGMSFGANAGYAINPARDLGPRTLAWLAGWDEVAFPGVNGYFWVPLVGPLLGGVLGAWIYDFLIHGVLRARGEAAAGDVEVRGETVRERPHDSQD